MWDKMMCCVVESFIHERNDLKATCRKLYEKFCKKEKLKSPTRRQCQKVYWRMEMVREEQQQEEKHSKYKHFFVLFVDITLVFGLYFIYA